MTWNQACKEMLKGSKVRRKCWGASQSIGLYPCGQGDRSLYWFNGKDRWALTVHELLLFSKDWEVVAP